MKNLCKIFIAVAAIAMSICVWSCSKDDDDSKKSNQSSTYCWDFLYKGSVVTSQCGLTESDADKVISEMQKQGYTITKRRQ